MVYLFSVGHAVPVDQEANWKWFLQNSNEKKIGAWEVIPEDGKNYVVFTAKLPLSNLKSDFLFKICADIASIVDKVESKLSTEDRF